MTYLLAHQLKRETRRESSEPAASQVNELAAAVAEAAESAGHARDWQPARRPEKKDPLEGIGVWVKTVLGSYFGW